MAAKEFKPNEIEVLLFALGMYINSMDRRVVAEHDAEAKVVWQRKSDLASVLVAKVRSV